MAVIGTSGFNASGPWDILAAGSGGGSRPPGRFTIVDDRRPSGFGGVGSLHGTLRGLGLLAGQRDKKMILNEVDLELVDIGEGRPILFLHPAMGPQADAPILDLLAEHGRVIAPSHPGFGGSSLPRNFSTVDDLAYLYLDLLDALDLRDCLLVGVSFGGWVAAEVAVKCRERISGLVLASPLGVKLGGPEDQYLVDMFNISRAEYLERAYADPDKYAPDLSLLDDDEVVVVARNRDAAALFGWTPYMYDPKLGQRLHRVGRPTLVLKGENDRMIRDGYLENYASLIGGRLETIQGVGHYPHIERPEFLAGHVRTFLNQLPASVAG